MNSSELRLNSKIYDIESVKYSIAEYKDISDISVSEQDGYIVCSFSRCQNGIQETIKEFENYVIYSLNSGKKLC